MKLLMENWNKYLSEVVSRPRGKTGTIHTAEGDKEVPISLESEHWFVYRSGRHYILTHKATGDMVPSKYYAQRYGFKLSDLKRLMIDLENDLQLPDIGSKDISPASIFAIAEYLIGEEALNEIIGQETSDALKSFSDSAATTSDDLAASADAQKASYDANKKTSDSFKEFADAIGAFSDSVGDNAESSDKMLELFKTFEEAGLEDFLDKIKDLAPLADLLDTMGDDGEKSGEILAALTDAGIEPDEFQEKMELIQTVKEEFDEFKKEDEQQDEENAKAAEEQEKRMKELERQAGDQEAAAEAAAG